MCAEMVEKVFIDVSCRLLLAPATSDEFLDPFSLQETQTPATLNMQAKTKMRGNQKLSTALIHFY